MEKTRKDGWKLLLCAVLTVAAVLYSSEQIFIKGILEWCTKQKIYHMMAAEVVLLFVLFFVVMAVIKNTRMKLFAVLLVMSVFLWGHMAFVPVVVSGLYIGYLLFVGRWFRSRVLRLAEDDGAAADFLAGSSLVVLIFCAMSAAGIGSIPWLQGAVGGSVALFLVWRLLKAGRGEDSLSRLTSITWPDSLKGTLCLAFILAMLCIQLGRLNSAVDFDSLWYGVRPQYILNNGNGIYENLGTIGIVYTYSKGWEILTLPLSTLPSYSFLLSFNVWMTAGVLVLGYKIAGFFMGKEYSMAAAAFLSAIPGIMNMADSAKTDMITLLFQLILIYYLLCYLKNGRKAWRYLIYSAAAFFFSWTLKPTAMVFSTAIFGMSGLFLLWNRFLPFGSGKKKEKKICHQAGSLGILLVTVAALLAVWARTMIITGLPVTSVFSSVLTKIGFEMKYPFHISSIPNSGAGLSAIEQAVFFAKRLFGFLLRPLGDDMDHVILAWGGFALFAMMLLWITCLFCRKRVDNDERRFYVSYLKTVYIPFLIVNLVSLFMLSQVDGNYFMLLYLLTVVYVLRLADRLTARSVRRGVIALLVPVMCLGAVTASLTNWSWSLGFSPVSWKHRGYYNHQEVSHQLMITQGNGQIWDILAEDPKTRLISVGSHPETLAFPCNVQSYDDINGSWGNVYLVKDMDSFVEFMDYARTDYVYVQAGYMKEEQRRYSLVRSLIEYGKIVPVCYEAGNVLARVDIDGEYTAESRAALEEFDRNYTKAEASGFLAEGGFYETKKD